MLFSRRNEPLARPVPKVALFTYVPYVGTAPDRWAVFPGPVRGPQKGNTPPHMHLAQLQPQPRQTQVSQENAKATQRVSCAEHVDD